MGPRRLRQQIGSQETGLDKIIANGRGYPTLRSGLAILGAFAFTQIRHEMNSLT